MKIKAKVWRKRKNYTNKNMLWFLINFKQTDFVEFLEDVYNCGYNDDSKLQYALDNKYTYECIDDIIEKYHNEEYSFDSNWLNDCVDDKFFTDEQVSEYFRFLSDVSEAAYKV